MTSAGCPSLQPSQETAVRITRDLLISIRKQRIMYDTNIEDGLSLHDDVYA